MRDLEFSFHVSLEVDGYELERRWWADGSDWMPCAWTTGKVANELNANLSRWLTVDEAFALSVDGEPGTYMAFHDEGVSRIKFGIDVSGSFKILARACFCAGGARVEQTWEGYEVLSRWLEAELRGALAFELGEMLKRTEIAVSVYT